MNEALSAALKRLQAGTLWKTYARANPKECVTVAGYITAVANGGTPTPPTVATATGSGLIDLVAAFVIAPVDGWGLATAYTQTRPSFFPLRTIGVSTPTQLVAAISDLQAGDLVQASASFTFPGQLRIENKMLSSDAVIDLDNGENVVGFTGGPGSICALYLNDNKNLRLYVNDITNPDAAGVKFYDNDTVLVWIKKIHDTAGGGFDCFPATGPITNCDIFLAEVTNWWCTADPTLDPHAEKGTGIHGINVGDVGNTGADSVTNTRIAIWGHDGPSGACMEYGDSGGGDTGNTLYVKAERMTKVSTAQTAGNAINLWGIDAVSADLKYLEATDCQGYALSVYGDVSGVDFSQFVVERAVVQNCNLNPHWPAPALQPGPTYKSFSRS